MKKICLVSTVSICAVVLLVLGSLTNIVGCRMVPSESIETKDTSPNGSYVFAKAYVWGKYELMQKGTGDFHMYNSNITNYTILVWGYQRQDHHWIHVLANDVQGGTRIGFIDTHKCCIFAFSSSGLIVSGIPVWM
jgi:hypothetical protein